jgi:hypothetical protein
MTDNNAAESPKAKKFDESGGKSFVQKLYNILQDPDNDESDSRSLWWTPDGKGILVSPKKFEESESKKYFQGTRYFGFSRRLMRNYFDRVSDSDCQGMHEYRHRDGLFQRDHPNLLNKIKFNNKRPYRKEAENDSPSVKPPPRALKASPLQQAAIAQATEPQIESSAVSTPSRASLLSLPFASDLPSFRATSSTPPPISQQLINLSQSSFLQHQAMRQAEEERRELRNALESQRSIMNASQSLDRFVLYQLLQEEAHQQRLQNSLLQIAPQLTLSMNRNARPSVNLAPVAAQLSGQSQPSTEDEALARYIRELLRFRRGGP